MKKREEKHRHTCTSTQPLPAPQHAQKTTTQKTHWVPSEILKPMLSNCHSYLQTYHAEMLTYSWLSCKVGCAEETEAGWGEARAAACVCVCVCLVRLAVLCAPDLPQPCFTSFCHYRSDNHTRTHSEYTVCADVNASGLHPEPISNEANNIFGNGWICTDRMAIIYTLSLGGSIFSTYYPIIFSGSSALGAEHGL